MKRSALEVALLLATVACQRSSAAPRAGLSANDPWGYPYLYWSSGRASAIRTVAVADRSGAPLHDPVELVLGLPMPAPMGERAA